MFLAIEDLNKLTDEIPPISAIETELATEPETLTVFQTAMQVGNTLVTDSEYVAHCKLIHKIYIETDVKNAISDIGMDIAKSPKDLKSLSQIIEAGTSKFYEIRNKLQKENLSTSGLLFGKEATQEFREDYETIEKNRDSDNAMYADLGLKGMERVQICRGDLVSIAGYTSHGKSVLARHLVYRSLIHYTYIVTGKQIGRAHV